MEFDTKLNPSRDLLVAEFPCNTAYAVKPAGVALVRARFYHILPFVISDIDHWRAAIRTDCVFFFVKSCPAAYISIDQRRCGIFEASLPGHSRIEYVAIFNFVSFSFFHHELTPSFL